jgi:uncharacterized membrane protein
MSAIHPPHHTTSSTGTNREASGESIFFVMAGAFGVLVLAIIGGAFLPVAVGVSAIFAVLFVVLLLVGRFLGRVLSDG